MTERWHGAPYGDRPSIRCASTSSLRACLSGDKVDFAGDFYQVKGFRLGVRLGQRRPRIVAALSRMLRLAGELADGVLLNYLPASHVRWSVDQVRAGEAQGGRPSRRAATTSSPTSTPVCAGDEGIGLAARSVLLCRGRRIRPQLRTSRLRRRSRRDPRSGMRRTTVKARWRPSPIGWSTPSTSWATRTRCTARCRRTPAQGSTARFSCRSRGEPTARRPPKPRSRRDREGVVVELEGKVTLVTGGRERDRRRAVPSVRRRGRRRRCRGRPRPGGRVRADELEWRRDGAGRRCLARGRDRRDHTLGWRGSGPSTCSSATRASAAAAASRRPTAWQRAWEVHVMHHVWAVRAVLPSMLGRSDGYILTTASAARLLTNIGAAPTPSPSMRPSPSPSGCRSPMVTRASRSRASAPGACALTCCSPSDDPAGAVVLAEAIEPEDVADSVVDGLRTERFLISPIPSGRPRAQAGATATVGSRGCGSCNVASAMRWAGRLSGCDGANRLPRPSWRATCSPSGSVRAMSCGTGGAMAVGGSRPECERRGDGSIGVRDERARPGRSSSSGSRCAGAGRGARTTWEPVADVAGNDPTARPAVTAFVDGSGPCRAFPVHDWGRWCRSRSPTSTSRCDLTRPSSCGSSA